MILLAYITELKEPTKRAIKLLRRQWFTDIESANNKISELHKENQQKGRKKHILIRTVDATMIQR